MISKTLDVLATVLVIVLSVDLLVTRNKTRPAAETAGRPPSRAAELERRLPPQPIPVADAASKGSPNAPLVLIAYSDFQCPFCRKFAVDVMPHIERQYVASGRLRLAFRHVPLEGIHPFALKAAEAAECAGRQGKFWDMHDLLFANQTERDAAVLPQWGAQLGLDANRFGKCIGGETVPKIRTEALAAKALGVAGTPAFFLGTVQPDGRVKVAQRLQGAAPLERFQAAIDALEVPVRKTRP